MAAVIRLKRKVEDEPVNTVILNCKKRKTEGGSQNEDSELSAVLKLAGTINNQEDDIFAHLKKPTKNEFEEQFKKHSIDISAKLRAQKQEDSRNSRYKVVSCMRSKCVINPDENVKETIEPEVIVYDIETESHEDHLDNAETQTKYVYDLYYTTSDDLGDACLEDYVSMYPYHDNLIFGSLRDNGLNGPGSEDDSEDSNAESNWKNDYPDESDMESITEDDMVQAMKRCDLSDLSSDNGEENFVYSADNETADYEEDLEDSDIEKYGERYARFKAKYKKEDIQTSSLSGGLYYGDIDEEEYYY